MISAPSSMFPNAESTNSEEPTLELDGQVPAITNSSSEPTKEFGLHSEDTKGLSEDFCESKPEGQNVILDKADTRKHDRENGRNERARMAGKEPMKNYNSSKADTKASLKENGMKRASKVEWSGFLTSSSKPEMSTSTEDDRRQQAI